MIETLVCTLFGGIFRMAPEVGGGAHRNTSRRALA